MSFGQQKGEVEFNKSPIKGSAQFMSLSKNKKFQGTFMFCNSNFLNLYLVVFVKFSKVKLNATFGLFEEIMV